MTAAAYWRQKWDEADIPLDRETWQLIDESLDDLEHFEKYYALALRANRHRRRLRRAAEAVKDDVRAAIVEWGVRQVMDIEQATLVEVVCRVIDKRLAAVLEEKP